MPRHKTDQCRGSVTSNDGESTPMPRGQGSSLHERAPLGNLTNLSTPDARNRRRREKYASMSAEEKEALLQKARGNYRQRKKGTNLTGEAQVVDNGGEVLTNENFQLSIESGHVADVDSMPPSVGVESTPMSRGPHENAALGDLTNLSAADVRNKRRREKYASMTVEEKEALRQRSRDYYKQRKIRTNLMGEAQVVDDGGEVLTNGLTKKRRREHHAVLTPRRLPFTSMSETTTSVIPPLHTQPTVLGAEHSVTNEIDMGASVTPMSCLIQPTMTSLGQHVSQSNAAEDMPAARLDGASCSYLPPPSGAIQEGNVGVLHASNEYSDDDDDESYITRGQDIVYESYQTYSPVLVEVPSSLADEALYKELPDSPTLLRQVPNCIYCGAKKYQYETPAWCCNKGKIIIAYPDVPPELHRLFTSQHDADAKYFRNNIRYFNTHFSFTSMGVTLDKRYCNGKSGVYTFRAQGAIYHRLDQLTPADSGPRHLQLYIYDTDAELAHRVRRSPNIDLSVVRKVLTILEDNPYVQTLRSMGSVPNLDDYRISLNTNIMLDQRVYNAPTVSQVAAIWVEGNDPQNHFDRSIVVFSKQDNPRFIKAYHGCYDPLAYPLFFPRGEIGWNRFMPYANEPMNEHPFRDALAQDGEGDESGSGKYVSAREYYCYKLQIRPGIFNIVLYGGRLFQQFVVDMYIKIEGMRLDFFLKEATQVLIRADLYQGVVDTIAAGETRASVTGKRIVLPPTFTGGERDMKRRFFDAMALVQYLGKPDIFMTMTSNPQWEEITGELAPGQTPQDRPDLVARVFRAKVRDAKNFIIKGQYFGEVAAYVHVTEFQKRGLPHEHFLFIMKPGSKLTTPDQYDTIISAELPDKDKYPLLHKLVVKHMMHGPCGVLNKNCACMVDGVCRSRYPRQFCNSTQQGKDSYPIYRRREDGRRVKVRGAELDNRSVVPYNPGLLMRYNCHINLEVCSSIKAVKYLFKYVYKGHDRASFSVDSEGQDTVVNEVRMYKDARFIGPAEAMWRIYGFDLFDISPPVLQLQLHLPGMHTVAFRGSANLEDVVARESASRSMLTEFFKMNQEDPGARCHLYREFPQYATWNKGTKRWKKREQRTQIGRLVAAHPAEGERYFLRVLLNHVRGPLSFEDLRTFEGVTYPSFRIAAEKRGLIEADKTLDDCMTEAATFQMPYALRRLFATIMVFCEVTDVRNMWDKHLDSMSEDYRRNHTNNHLVEQLVLRDIRDLVHSMGKDISSYGLPDLTEASNSASHERTEVREEMSIEVDQAEADLYLSLNTEQRSAFDEIMEHVVSGNGAVFFVDGPGGTGKTYLYKALLARVRAMGLIAIATATSGIAASIMPGGRTAHSRFKIPINLGPASMCSFTKQSGTAELLRRASLIIWDEVAMTKRQAVETLDRSLQDATGSTSPFGGKIMVFGGDFRQVLPVVRRGTRAQITDATLQRSYLWEHIRKIRLTRNMRAQSDPWFSEFLLRIGNGTEETIGDGYVRLPDDIVVGYGEKEESINMLINEVFPSLELNARSASYMSTRAILATKNEYVDELNAIMIDRFVGQEKIYYSFDTVEDDHHNHYPNEYLNSLTPNGLPPHVLKIKINCPVILLRNLDPHNGLCNGTRLMVRAFQNNAIDAEIVLGQHAGKRVFIPRIPLCPSEDLSLPFKFKRKQFPIRLSFAMTINKAQGQTIPNVGIYLPEPVFSHGQLYVALSRGVSRETTRILAKPRTDLDPTGKSTKNIVYTDVLE